jgi:Predicted glycosyltransferases
MLNSVEKQTVMPDQVIIVDGSDEPIENDIQHFLSKGIDYIRVYPPSLTKQRNAGFKVVNEGITLVGYLDDDIELEMNAVEKLLSFWETCADDIGGTSFNITNNPVRKSLTKPLLRFFMIESNVPGKVLRSGFNTGVYPLEQNTYSEWLCGGATVWKKDILDKYEFDEWYKGWAYYEDVEFSHRVARNYKLVVLSDARLEHNPPPYNIKRNYILGKMAVINRYHFVKKNTDLSVSLYYWSLIGEITINIMQSIWERNLGGFRLAFGNISGLIDIVTGKLVQVDVNFRK